MSLKTAFTKLGLVEDTVPVTKTKTKQSVTTVLSTAPTYTAPPATTANVDEETAKVLEQSLQDNKLSGFDYLKFVAATEETKTYGVPEETRYKMAFSTAKQLGLDKDSLLKSGQHYIDVLAQNERDFKSDCTQFERINIQTKEVKIAELETKLTTLSEQLAQTKRERDDLASEVQENKSTQETSKASFQATLQSFVGGIETNIAKINKYLS